MIDKLKIMGAVILALLVLVIVLQNTAAVETKLLFVNVTMPRAALLFRTLMVGFGLGVICAAWLGRGKKKSQGS